MSLIWNLPFLPKTRATARQMAVHGSRGTADLREAMRDGDRSKRFDAAIKSADSFDHALVDSSELPLAGRTFEKYYAGYGKAKTAAEVLLATGVIPGARERVGRSEITQSQSHFHEGLQKYLADGDTRVGRYQATNWIDHSFEDAKAGLIVLRKPAVAFPLLTGLRQTREAMEFGGRVPQSLVEKIDGLYAKARADLDARIEAAAHAAAAQPTEASAPAAPPA